MQRLFSLGIEKVSVNTAFVQNPELITKAAEMFGSQAVVASIDVKRDWLGRNRVYATAGRNNTGLDPTELAREFERRGVGEILLNSIDRDGTMSGYDLNLIREVATAVDVPVVACGGAGSNKDLAAAIAAGASAAGAGSLFVYQGPHRAVLINYPSGQELRQLFADSDDS
jgi:cyclase